MNEEIDAHSNSQRSMNGWWWGVWQGTRLVGFGAGYRDKRKCFKHEAACYKLACGGPMPTVECHNYNVVPMRHRIEAMRKMNS
jgi:hypothetical protein